MSTKWVIPMIVMKRVVNLSKLGSNKTDVIDIITAIITLALYALSFMLGAHYFHEDWAPFPAFGYPASFFGVAAFRIIWKA